MLNDIVIPNAKAQTGFQKGVWLRSAPSAGLGLVVFDTEDNATAAMPSLTPPPGGPGIAVSPCLWGHWGGVTVRVLSRHEANE